ncbi:hypothetical protein HY57_02065 [Dyella japonica A8]|uniref:Uncharacterized protein n=2 Tax=Dyella japonica TaxID=231455 RepID=A0A075K1K7_9GAMM|nr:hypothetical protein HY57_02065 [Dyella japonica A8]
MDPIDWNAKDREANAAWELLISDGIKRGGADKDFFESVLFARRQAQADGDMPSRTQYGELKYSRDQIARAAAHGREDIAAVLAIQLKVLKRLSSLRALAWLAIALLAYIAYRVR